MPYKWAWFSNDAYAIAVLILQKKCQQSLQNSFSVSDTLEIISFWVDFDLQVANFWRNSMVTENCITTFNSDIMEGLKAFSGICLEVFGIIHVAIQWHIFV